MNHMSVKWSSKSWKWTLVGLLVVVFCAFFLRIFKLNLIPVFADEAIYIRWAQVMRAEPSLRFLPLSDGKQPLFMWVTMPMLKFISDPLVAGRLVSVLAGLGTTIGVFVLSIVLFNSRKVGLLASLLYALSPFAVFFDRMALVDSMLSFFGIWTLVFMILAVRNLSLGLAFLAGFSLGGAMLTKSPALFFAMFLPVSLLFVQFKVKRDRAGNFFKSLGLFGAAFVLAFGMFNILRLGENFHMMGTRNFDYVYPYSHLSDSPLNPLLAHVDRALEWFMVTGPAALLFLAIAGFFVNAGKYKKEVLVLVVWGVLPILIQAEFAKVFTSRYIFFTLPPLVVLAASVLKRFKKPPYLYGVYALVALFFVQTFLYHGSFFQSPERTSWPERDGYMADWTAGTGIKEISALIKLKRDANPERQIVVGTEGYFGTLPDGLQIYLEKEPRITVIGVGLDMKEVPASLKEAANAGNITYLVANASRLKFPLSFENYGLRQVAWYEKAENENGYRDVLYLFEVL